jgi:putative ABC transport system permease protein
VRALDRKLLRELWHLRSQMFSIGAVVACGVLAVVALRGTYESLAFSIDSYYREYRFADVFVSLERAPESVLPAVLDIPGVADAEGRISTIVNLDVPGLDEPAIGQVLSLPAHGGRAINAIHLVSGRLPEPGRPDEVLASESFMNANALAPGDTLGVVLAGRWRQLEITGVAISPDLIGEVAPGTIFPDDRRFAVLRMERGALAAATGLEGAFNELSLQLAPGASEPEVIQRLDALLEPYGGLGAYGRSDHQSHEAIMGELEQNRITGTAIPAIFLAVAAFLLNLVLGRLVTTQRDQIAILKAFGYTNFAIGWHYLRFAMAAVAAGALAGTGLGIWMGGALIELYGEYFRFPDLEYRVSWGVVLLTTVVSAGAAALGALGAVRRAIRLPPAEAMRPEAPARFRPGPLERLGLGGRLPAAGRLILRNLERRPLRAVSSALGVAFSVAILMIGFYFLDVIGLMMDLQFRRIQREDMAVMFTSPRPPGVRHELAALGGVSYVETYRSVPIRLRAEHRSRTTALTGISADATLRPVYDRIRGPIQLPPEGLVLGTKLAEILEVEVGDTVRVEVLVGERREARRVVAGTVDEMFGIPAYMDASALDRMLEEGPAVTGAYLRVDADRVAELNDRLKRVPAVTSVHSPAALRRSFEQQLADNLMISVLFIVVLACVLSVGIIYNGARIALSERGRELASLRVLGFSRREVALLLLGEQSAITVAAIPVGWLIGVGFSAALVAAIETERYRFPLVLTPRTFILTAAITAAAAVLAGLAVRRRLNRLDLIEVLKTRE